MGRNHLRVLSLLKGVDIAFLTDTDQTTLNELGAAYEVPVLADLDSFDGPLDALVVATPTITHAEFIRVAAKRVRNIFVEKPLAATLTDAEEVARFSRSMGLNLQVGFIERFNPAVQELKSILKRSDRVVSIDFVRTNKLSSRITDVDVVMDLMIHDVDLALFLNGPARHVSAHGLANDRMIDFASASIVHENGRLSRIQASRITEKKKRVIEATCTDMFVDCELLRKEVVISRQSEISQSGDRPYTISAVQEAVEVKPQEALLLELQAFVASCNGKVESDTPGVEAGLAAIGLCDQIQKSVMLQ